MKIVNMRKAQTGRTYHVRALVNSENPTSAYVINQAKPPIPNTMGCVMFSYEVPLASKTGSASLLFEVPRNNMVQSVAIKLYDWEKILDFKASGEVEDPFREVELLQLVGDNKHVLAIKDLLCGEDYLYMVMPECPNGDLLSLIYNNNNNKNNDQEMGRGRGRGRLSEPVARFIFRQLLENLVYLKRHGVAHRDVSCENIMFDEHGRCLFIDLGMATQVPDDKPMIPSHHCGTFQYKLQYMAPEVYGNDQLVDGYASDLWSAAIVLYTMLTGLTNEPPAMDNDDDDDNDCCRVLLYDKPTQSDAIFKKLTHPNKKGLKGLLKSWDMTMSRDAMDLLQSIFQLNPSDRPSLEEVMKHPWVKNPDVITKEEFMNMIVNSPSV
eukprot:CAMPEP_0118725856 /NCGR_PEP_ID=MMETSP0800-20121206/33374_1 /TAXON_ID=210618 ORGANISM="Striatella unipunctata, Strain CCMP2910" /NCGR_SAMPLE_ID=MMETSP0800 /ASSEMBLY_ACC=CAM_ASM_000638 /LENGTH=379 /DNA_ID=CAMNT_0006634605 /DNA_START=96 /DNA_END=1235 /DNA_ORIENTATION=+